MMSKIRVCRPKPFITLLCLWLMGFASLGFASLGFAATTSQSDLPPLSQQEARQLLDVLNDPKQRDAFTHTLSLIARSLPPTPTNMQSTAVPTVDANIGRGFSSLRLDSLLYVRDFLGLFGDLKSIGGWAQEQLSSPEARQLIFHAFLGALTIIVCGLGVEYALVMWLAKPLRHLTQIAQTREQRQVTDPISNTVNVVGADNVTQKRFADQRRQVETLRLLVRIPFALGHFLIKTLPVIAFILVAYTAVWILPFGTRTISVTLTLADCYAAARCLYLFVETGLAPRSPTIRLIPASDTTARIITHWWTILVVAPAVVICLSNLGAEFSLSSRGTEAMIRMIVLIEHIFIACFIWRIHRIVANVLQNAFFSKSPLWTFIGAVARWWWIPAMFLDISLWIVWASHLHGGYVWICKTTGATIGILLASRIISVLIYGMQDRFFRISPALSARLPDLQKRADRYYPFVRTTLTGIILFMTLALISEAWGLPTLRFFTSNTFGSHLLGIAVSTLFAVTIAVIIWEMTNGLLNRQMTRFESSDQISRATRLRTVLPIIRTVLLAVIVIIVAVTTLSQIGINVTPLLTGAGILGAAIAFGSQSLVKDFITGFFMLVEDAIQVGDWVTTGGVSGIVETLSIRTVKVRDIDGDLHIIPFSSVSSIANTARGYNQIVVRQQVDLSEHIPRVVAIMADTIKDMRQDPVFGAMILSDFNDLGVDLSDSNGATVLGTIRTAPMMKWKIKREFYRRIAPLFASANIKFYTPTTYNTTPPDVPIHILAASATTTSMVAASEA